MKTRQASTFYRTQKMNSAKLIQVIQTGSSNGAGTTDDPHRIVTEYWSISGDLLARVDPFDPKDKDQQVCPIGDHGARMLGHLKDLENKGMEVACRKCGNVYDSRFEHLCPLDPKNVSAPR